MATTGDHSRIARSLMEAEGDPVLLFHRPNISTAGSNNSKATKQSTLNSNNNNASELDFVFRKRRDQINWRLLSSINVDRLMREVDVRTLQQVLDNVTYCDIESECLDNVDQNYVKLFQLSQLIIEYLLHCQEHLTGTKQTSKHLIDEVEEKHSKALKQIKALESQLAQVTKENRQLKKTVYAYQLWSKVPGGLNNQQPVVSAYHRCRYCPKVFNSEYYLESHLQRRHADRPNYLAETFPIPTAPQTAAKEDTGAVIDKITNTIERFSAKLIETERNLRAEMEAKLESQLNRKEHSMEEQTRQERLTYQRELQDLKTLIARQMEQEKESLRQERRALEELRLSQLRSASNLGKLEDDVADDGEEKESVLIRKLEQRYDSALNNLQSMLQQELSGIKAASQQQLDQSDSAKKLNRLEEALLYQQTLLNPPQTPEKDDKWFRYLALLKTFKCTPFQQYPIKCLYTHSANALAVKKSEVESLLQRELDRRGVSVAALKSSDEVAAIALKLKRDAANQSSNRPYYSRMREYLEQELDDLAGDHFKSKPLRPMQRVPTLDANLALEKEDYFRQGTLALTFNPISPVNPDYKTSSRSLNSDAISEVKWDQANEDTEPQSEEEDDENITELSSYRDAEELTPSTAPSSPTKSDNRFKVFAKALSSFKKSTSPNTPQPVKELDPALKQAVGHVLDSRSKKQPLESRKDSLQNANNGLEEDFDVSDISDSIDSLNLEIPKSLKASETSVTGSRQQQTNATTPDISEVLRVVKQNVDTNKPLPPPKKKNSWTDDVEEELQKF